MTEQRTPDELARQAYNELVCDRLLGWQRTFAEDGGQWWLDPTGTHRATATFDTWAEAGLILEALAARGFSYDLSHTQTENRTMQFGVIVWFPNRRYTVDADSLLVAIRSAALEYTRIHQ